MKMHLCKVFILCVVAAQVAYAAAPAITLITPRGGQRGTELEVTFNGPNLGDAAEILFYEPGITLVGEPRIVDANNAVFKFNIAADCAVGTHALRLRTRTGLSNLMLFSVGNLPERNEVEPNNFPSEAEVSELNNTINGVVNSEDVDYYSFNLEAGAKLAVEIEALRLGKDLFDPKVRLFDPSGHEVIAADDTTLLRQDAGFVYVAAEAGAHIVTVSEASYGGGATNAYRLHAGQFPRPMTVTPMGGAPGAEISVKWLGDPDIAEQNIIVPAVDRGTFPVVPQLASAVAPTGIPFRVSDLANALEVEPNNDGGTATPASIPAAFEGVIGEPGDVDMFTFNAAPGVTYQVKAWARDLGSPLDSVVQIVGPEGKGNVGNDDSGGLDSAMAFSAPVDGAYTMIINDQLKRGGPLFTYRVEITQDKPSMNMSMLENDPVSLVVPQNNRSYVLVNAGRVGFGEDVTVAMADLPAGLSFTETKIPAGQSVWPVMVTAAADAPVAGALSRIVGTQVVAEGATPVQGDILQNIKLIEGANLITFFGRDVKRLAVAVSEPAPFKVELVTPQAPFVRNGFRNLVVKATRAEGFKDAINLRFPWLPGGMGGGTAAIPAEQDTAEIRLEVRGDAAVGAHKIFVQANAAGFNLCTDWTPIEIQEEWVTFAVGDVETEQGKPVDLKVALTQVKPFEGEFELTLTGLPKGITTQNMKFSKDTTELIFPLAVTPEAPEGKFGPIVARTAIVLNAEPVSHNSGGGNLKVFKPLPAELQAQQPAPAPVEAAPGEVKRKTRFAS